MTVTPAVPALTLASTRSVRRYVAPPVEPRAGGPALPQHRRLVTAVPGPRSCALAARRDAAVPAGVDSAMPVYAVAAGGGVVVDVDGNSFIDLGSGLAATTVGASAPRVVDAVHEQVTRFTHTCFTVTPYDGYVAVAEALNAVTPGTFAKRTALFTTGAEAVENAVKIARAATGRPAVAVLDHACHGRTSLALAMTARSLPYKKGFGPFPAEVYRAPLSYPFRDGLDGPAAADRAIGYLERTVGAESLAALVVEPVLGDGVIVPAPGFLPALARWAREHGIVVVADEAQTGLARTGALFAAAHEHLVPDLVVTAKGIADGLPLAAVTGRAALMDAPHAGGLGGTYGGNPLACAAALATLRTIVEDGLVDRAAALGATMLRRLRAAQADDPRIGDVRGRGAMVGVEIVQSGLTEPDAGLARAVAAAAHRAGLIVLTGGGDGNVLRLLPPLTIDDALLEEALDVLVDVLARTF